MTTTQQTTAEAYYTRLKTAAERSAYATAEEVRSIVKEALQGLKTGKDHKAYTHFLLALSRTAGDYSRNRHMCHVFDSLIAAAETFALYELSGDARAYCRDFYFFPQA